MSRINVLVGVLLLVASSAQAQITLGAHLYTAHSNNEMHDSTPGLYVVWPVGVAGGSLITGAYRNSLNLENGARRTSFYAGQVWEWGRYSVTAALVTGYQRTTYYGDRYCPNDGRRYDWCSHTVGFVGGKLAPLVTPSIAFPEAKQYLGVTPRLALLAGKHSAALHVAAEF